MKKNVIETAEGVFISYYIPQIVKKGEISKNIT